MPTRGSGIEPFHFVGIEPFKMVGIEPFATMGIEPFKKGVRIEPFQTGGRNSSGQAPLIVGGEGAFGAGDAGSAALVADALNTATSSVVRWDDASVESVSFAHTEPIWRREGWVRAELAHQALMSRLRHFDGALWFVPEFQGHKEGAVSVQPQKLLSLEKPGEQDLSPQVAQVLARKDQRPDRVSEILVQIAHFWPFWTAITGIDPARHPRTYELLQIAASLSPAVGQPFKHALDVRRPHTMSALVQPIIPVPGHAAFPSGHSTGAHLFVEVMRQLLSPAPKEKTKQMLEQLERMATRIADNRVVAGVHYPIDGEAGRCLGGLLAQYFAACCGVDVKVQGGEGRLVRDGEALVGYELRAPVAVAVKPIDPLPALWNAARIELGF